MKRDITGLRKSLLLIGVFTMMIGLGSSLWIYQTAERDSGSVLGYEIIGGTAYPILPEDSRAYRRSVEYYGGTAAVIADDLNRWFAGLWHGKSLAFTIAGISIFIAFIFFLAANRLPYILDSDVEGENRRK